MLLFSTQLCELLPLLLSLLFNSPTPLPCVKYSIYTDSVWLGGGGGGNLGGEWPQTDKHLPQSPFTDKLFQMTTFCFGVCIDIQSIEKPATKSLYTYKSIFLDDDILLWCLYSELLVNVCCLSDISPPPIPGKDLFPKYSRSLWMCYCVLLFVCKLTPRFATSKLFLLWCFSI